MPSLHVVVTCYELSKGSISFSLNITGEWIFITFLRHDLYLFHNGRNRSSLPNMHDLYLALFLSFHLERQS